MEGLPVTNLSAHRLRQRLAKSAQHPSERTPISPLAGGPLKQKSSESLPPPPVPPPPTSLPALSPPSTPSPLRPTIHADPDSASAASPTFVPPPPPPPPPPPLPRPSYPRRFLYTPSPTVAHTIQASSPNQEILEPPGQEQLLPEGNAQQNSKQNEEREYATQQQKEAETPEIAKATTAIGVSLKQHVQQDDAARKEAMRSFILDRFLPAAKAVAADHESSISVASRNRVLPRSASMPQQTHKAQSSHRRDSAPSKAPKGFTSSRPLHSKQQHKGSSYSQDSMKSCGFFCVGLKTAISSAHRIVSASARSVSRSKSREPTPSSQVNSAREDINSTSSDEEEAVVPKVKATVHGMWKQRTALTPASISYSSSSPTTATFRGSTPRYAASLRDSFSRGGSTSLGGSPLHYVASSGSTPLHSQSGRCSLRASPLLHQTGRHNLTSSPLHDHVGGTSLGSSPLHEQTVRGTRLGSTPLHEQAVGTGLGGTPPHDQGDTSNLRGTPPHDQGDTSNLRGMLPHDHARGTPLHDQAGRTSLGGTPLLDPAGGVIMNGIPVQDQAGRTSSNGSPAHDYAVKSPRRDQDGEDDEPRFYDALSRFGSTPGNVTPYTIGSPKSQYEAFGFPSDWTNDKVGFADASRHFETPRASSDYESVGSDAGHGRDVWQSQKSMGVKTSSLSQRVGKALTLETRGEEADMQDKDSLTYHLLCKQGASADPFHVRELHQQHEQVDLKKESHPRMMRRPSLEAMNGVCSSNTSSVPPIFPAKCQKNMPNGHKRWASSNDLGWPLGISSYHSSTQKSFQGQQKSIARFVPGSSVPSPPLPPSPAVSWLEKAIIMNASKPSTLATLQQKDKTSSARKKLEFTSTDASVAKVKWEDVVKGSQIQQGHLRFSEEPHHHHPSNLNAMKPLRL